MKQLGTYNALLVKYISRHRFLAAIALVVGITGVLTTFSMTLYVQSGASGLDLSRPGFVDSRKNLQQDTTNEFKAIGELSSKDITAFKKLYEAQRSTLNSLGAFDDNTMSDEALGFTFSPDRSDQQTQAE